MNEEDALIKRFVCRSDSLGWEAASGLRVGYAQTDYYPTCGACYN